MKIKLLSDQGSHRSGEVVEAALPEDRSEAVFYPKGSNSYYCLSSGQFIVAEEPVGQVLDAQTGWFGQPMSKLQVEFK